MALSRTLIGLLLLSACSAEQRADGVAGKGPAAHRAGGGSDVVLAVYKNEGQGGMDALVQGVLVREGPCLYLDQAAPGTTRLLPVFPASEAEWDAARGALIHAGREIRPGSRVTFAGGEVRGNLMPLLQPLPPVCDRNAQWIVAPQAKGRAG